MDRAIRHPDGRLLEHSEYRAIRASARRLIEHHLLTLPPLRNGPTKKRPLTKMYYRTHHQVAWYDVIKKLEAEQPLVALCASNWKADHLLGSILLSIEEAKHRRKKKQMKAKQHDDDDDNDDTSDGNSTSSPIDANERAATRSKSSTELPTTSGESSKAPSESSRASSETSETNTLLTSDKKRARSSKSGHPKKKKRTEKGAQLISPADAFHTEIDSRLQDQAHTETGTRQPVETAFIQVESSIASLKGK